MSKNCRIIQNLKVLLLAGALLILASCGQNDNVGITLTEEPVAVTLKGTSEKTSEETVSTDPLDVASEENLILQYDDYYDFTESFPEYKVLSIEQGEITSFVVEKGNVSDQKDSYVALISNEGLSEIHTCGVGSATVYLVEEERLDEAQDAVSGKSTPAEAIPVIAVHLKVEPAVLTVLFLSGQSNMSGNCSDASGYHPEDSVMCERGQVYSTYLDTQWKGEMVKITGVDYEDHFEVEELVPEALNSEAKALNGEQLRYPLNALTADGNGKTGPDSGIAYEWNRLSGDKVWTVNVSCGASNAKSWCPGGENREIAEPMLSAVLQVYRAELASGHFTEGNRLLFWQQGEADVNTIYEEYKDNLTEALGTLDNELDLDAIGLITTRTWYSSLGMYPPRLAEYALSCTNGYDSKIYMASNVNENWVTDEQVKAYFEEAYPEGELTYPLRDTATVGALPQNVDEVHADIHYSQVGHNENGLTAARNMYEALNGDLKIISPITWVTDLYATGQAVTETYKINGVVVPCAVREVNVGHIYLFAIPSNPIAAKNVKLTFDTFSIRQETDGSGLYLMRTGTYYVIARDTDGTPLAAIKLIVYPRF